MKRDKHSMLMIKDIKCKIVWPIEVARVIGLC